MSAPLIAEKLLDAGVALAAAVVGALILYWLGQKAYIRQRQREEIHDSYITNGIFAMERSISRSFSAYQYNREVAGSLLRYMRDYDPTSPRKLTADLFQETFTEARLPDDFLSSMNRVVALFQADEIVRLLSRLQARLTEGRIHQFEVLAVFRAFLSDPANFGDDPKAFAQLLQQGMDADQERISRALVLSDRLRELETRIFAEHSHHFTFTALRAALLKDDGTQQVLAAIRAAVAEIAEEARRPYRWPPETPPNPER